MTNAKEFALTAHKYQTRKGKITPYSFHLFLVNNILKTLTEDSNIIATGWLHDTVEDTDVSLEDIKQEFNDEIYSYMSLESEDKSIKDWQTRKELQLAKFREVAKDESLRKVLLVTFSDKLANLMEIYQDYLIIGDLLWDRFNSKDPKKQLWYFNEFYKIFKDNKDLFSKNEEILDNYREILNLLFYTKTRKSSRKSLLEPDHLPRRLDHLRKSY